MTISIIHAIGAVSLALATVAARPTCSRDNSASASSNSAANATSTSTSAPSLAATAGPGLPADFPRAPGLSACKPIVEGGQIICQWHGVDGHTIYTFYHEALPKAGYTLLPGAQEVTTPHYIGAIGFRKGSAQGAVTIAGGDLTIQYLPHE
jgi:hypothetical protein